MVTFGYLFADLPDGLMGLCRDMFALVPVGFLVAMLCAVVSYGVFGVFGLIRRLV